MVVDSATSVDGERGWTWRRRCGAISAATLLLGALLMVGLDGPAGAAAPTVSGRKVVATGSAQLGPPQQGPQVAFDGTNFLVAWFQGGQIRAARVSGDGGTVTQLGQVAADASSSSYPGVAFNGTNFLVVWQSTTAAGDIKGRLVGTSGGLTNPVITVASTAAVQDRPAVTAGGSTFFVVWHDERSGGSDVYGRRVGSSGSLLGTAPTPIATDDAPETSPDVAWNGSTYLVVSQLTFAGNDEDVVGQRVSSTATLVDEAFAVSATSPADEQDPAVASDGNGWYVVWSDNRANASQSDVYGAPVSSAGIVSQAGVPLGAGAGFQDRPDIAWNGSYLAAWSDTRSGSPDIYATRITNAGVIQDPNGYAIANQPVMSFEGDPAVSRASGTNKWAIDDFAQDVDGGNPLIEHRTSPK